MALTKTFSGSILPSDLNRLQEDYGAAFGFLKILRSGSVRLDTPPGGIYLIAPGSTSILPTSPSAGLAVFYLDPSWFAVSPINERTVYYQVATSILINSTFPSTTFTTSLYPVTGTAGGGNAVTVSLGSPVGGSSASFANPKANVASVSGFFPAPMAGFYTIGIAVASNVVSNSSIVLNACLQMKQE